MSLWPAAPSRSSDGHGRIGTFRKAGKTSRSAVETYGLALISWGTMKCSASNPDSPPGRLERLGDVRDVWKRPKTRLERPVPTGLLREMRFRVATRLVRRGRLGRLKPSQVVPRRGLEVPGSLLSLSGMSPRFAADAGIGADASPTLPTRGEVLHRTPVEHLATEGRPRVRAPERATRSANSSGCCQSESTGESSARLLPHARRRRSERRLPFAAGGPGPLTEDRQKPRVTL
jgi:hypothetical protein